MADGAAAYETSYKLRFLDVVVEIHHFSAFPMPALGGNSPYRSVLNKATPECVQGWMPAAAGKTSAVLTFAVTLANTLVNT